MNNSKNIIIDKYTQPIFYPEYLYVIKNPTDDYIMNNFEWSDGGAIEKSELLVGKGVTYSGICKKDDSEHNLCIVICIFTKYFDNKLDVINVCAHEANHATFRMLDYCGIQQNDSTTEVFAFVQGWITKCVYTTYKKKTNE